MRTITSTEAPQSFFSLKWRALAIFSLLLLAINGFSLLYFSNSLSKQFDLERKSSFEMRVQELDGTVRQSAARLLTLADIVSSLSRVEAPVLTKNARIVTQALDQHWQALEFGGSVDMAQIYSTDNELIRSWQAENVDLPVSELFRDYVRKVSKAERPMTFFDCTNKCMQFAASPMFGRDQSSGVIVVGATLVPGIISFKESSSADIGILNVANRNQISVGEEQKYIGNWHTIVSALTNLGQNLPLLQSAASEKPSLAQISKGMRKIFNGREFEIHLLPVKSFSGTGDAYFVIIDDITEKLQQIREANWRNVIFAVVGALLSESLLLLILWKPLSRLKRTAGVLPLLTRNAFEQIRQAVGRKGRKSGYKDEFDMLDDTLVTVSQQLESLQGEVARRTADLRQANEQLGRLNEDLKMRARQLLDAQEELVLKEKLALLGQVAGSVGHELRNPLGVMNNAVYFLQNTVLSNADEITTEYLNLIRDEIAVSERIVADLLDSVRTTPPRPQAVGVDHLIERTLSKCAIPPSVIVNRDFPTTLQPLQVDPMQIQQVFQNLVRNAVEAMPEGGELAISAVENNAEKTITVSVRDTGIGMTTEQLGKLFQPLFTTKARGIGLGLVVVKNLTQANGGSVEVRSEFGKGTVFAITLPSYSSSSDAS